MSDHASHFDPAAGGSPPAGHGQPAGEAQRQSAGQVGGPAGPAAGHGGYPLQQAAPQGPRHAHGPTADPISGQAAPARPVPQQPGPQPAAPGHSAGLPPMQPQQGMPGPVPPPPAGPQARAYGAGALGDGVAAGPMGAAAGQMPGTHQSGPYAQQPGAGYAGMYQAAHAPQVQPTAMPHAGPQHPFPAAGMAAPGGYGMAGAAGYPPAAMAGYGMAPAPGYGVGYADPAAMMGPGAGGYAGTAYGPQPGFAPGAGPGAGFASGAAPGPAAAPGAQAGAAPGRGPQAGMADVLEELANGGNGLSSLTRLLSLEDSDFWKGALVGAAAVLLFTNDSVQDALFKSGARAKEAVQSGADKLKQAAGDAADKPQS